MHLKRTAVLILSVAILAVTVKAQTESETAEQKATPVFIEKIMEGANGNLVIDIPDNIIDEILKEEEPVKRQPAPLRPGINKVQGFRIQVFGDGSNQHSLEARARARGNAIAARFPKYKGQVYSYSSSPNWYTRVGNFRSQEEASSALAELKRAFPQYASEMRIVKSQIVVIK